MPPRDARLYLLEMIAAGERAARLAESMSVDEFVGDADARLIAERCFEILGEALNQMLKHEPVLAARFPAAPRVIALRNMIAHAYFRVDPVILHDVAAQHVGPVVAAARAVLAERGGPEGETAYARP